MATSIGQYMPVFLPGEPHPFPDREASKLQAAAAAAAVASVVSDSVWPHKRQPTRLRRPWESPGKNTGVGCHFLLQCRKVKSESEVTQLCLTLRDPMDCSLPGSSIHGIFQARVLEWGAIAFPEATVYRIAKSQTLPMQPCAHRQKNFFACSSSAPVRVEREGGAAAWLAPLGP